MPLELDLGTTDAGPDRQTRVIGGNGSDTLSYVLPAGLFQYIEAILVNVDASGAGAAVRPELSIATENGAVIATQRQGDAIPVADSGSATFALRLADNGGQIRFNRHNQGGFLDIETTGQGGSLNAGVAFTVGADGFEIIVTDAVTGDFHVVAPFFDFDANNGIFRFHDSSLFDVSADDITLFSGDALLALGVTGEVTITLGAGQPFTVQNSSGNPIFRVDEDGDLHGKTGKALVFDL